MTSQTKSVTEPLPHHLKALLDLTREAEPPTMRTWLRDYRQVVVLSIGYGLMAFVMLLPGENYPATILFFAALALMFALNDASERQARKRWRLLLEVLYHQSCEEKNATNQPVSESQ